MNNEMIGLPEEMTSAFHSFAQSKSPKVREVALDVGSEMANSNPIVVLNPNNGNIGRNMIDFRLYPSPSHLSERGYVGVLDVDRMRYLMNQGMYPDLFKAELIRTLSVARQYLRGGYERRLREVYTDAVVLEKEWYISDSRSSAQADIFVIPVENRVRYILGYDRFNGDVGFADWQVAVDELSLKATPNELMNLKRLRGAIRHFLIRRDRNAGVLVSSMPDTYKSAFLAKSEDERAKIIATDLVGHSLLAGQQGLAN